MQEIHHTGSRATRLLGAAVVLGLVVLFVLGWFVAPEDDEQQDAVRMIFVHVPSAIWTYIAFVTTAIGSVMWLVRRSVWWDTVAAAAAEIGVLFCGLTLFTGSIWGRPTWNTYWDWGDVRLVTTLILFLMMIGYLSVRSLGGAEEATATRAAIIGVLAAAILPIVNRSVEWWENNTLHQKSSLTDGNLEDMTLFALVLGLVVWGLFFWWSSIHRFRIAWLERELRVSDLDEALRERRAEGSEGDGAGNGEGGRRMTHLGYLLVGWGTTLAVGALYAASLLRRGRRLSARVPAERRRWMTAVES